MKKILSLFLLIVLVACGSSDGDDSVNDITTTTTTSTIQDRQALADYQKIRPPPQRSMSQYAP